jgi:vacuolar-type H+-ATPase subunit H
MGLIDKFTGGIERFAEEADKVIDKGKAKVGEMQTEMQMDGLAKKLGYLVFDFYRGREVDQAYRQKILDDMSVLEDKIFQARAEAAAKAADEAAFKAQQAAQYGGPAAGAATGASGAAPGAAYETAEPAAAEPATGAYETAAEAATQDVAEAAETATEAAAEASETASGIDAESTSGEGI